MKRLIVSLSVLMSFFGVLAAETADVYAVPVVSNFVAAGTSSAYAEDVRFTAGTTVLKTGGGTLVVPASETGFAPPAFHVREGAVEYRNDLAAARVADRQTKDRKNVRIGIYGFSSEFYDEAHVDELTECNVDFVRIASKKDRAVLDLLAQRGIDAYVSDAVSGWFTAGDLPNAGKMAEKRPLTLYQTQLADFTASWTHPAIRHISLSDEPSALDFEHLGKVCALIDGIAPETPAFVNLLPNYASTNTAEKVAAGENSQLGTFTYQEHIDQYCAKVPTSYICYDHYMMYDDANAVRKFTVPRMYENYRIVADACRRTGRDFWYIAQLNTQPGNTKKLSLGQLRYQAWTAMAFGAVQINWACWAPRWWTNNVYDENGVRDDEQFAKMKAVNAEIHAIGGRFMAFKNTATRFVDFGAGYAETASTGAFSAVRATDESPILVGEMVARDGGGAEAIFVVAAGDPMGESAATHTVRFTAAGQVAAIGSDGLPIALTDEGDDTYSFTLADNACALVTKDCAATVGTAGADLSDAVKAKLGLWVSLKDRAHVVPVTAGGKEIETWYDVRETDIANPKYVRLQSEHAAGKPGPTVEHPLYVRKYSSETNTQEMAYFGGYGSGVSMRFLKPDGTAYMQRPMEMSTAYGYISGTFGYLYGNSKETSEHRLWNENNALPWASAWGSALGDTRIWIDGRTVDRSIGTLPYGFHTLHTRVNTMTSENLSIFENALFSVGTAGTTKGGQYVGEVMFFTNRLTHAERCEVQRYLNRKWFGRTSSTVGTALESGVELDVIAEGTVEADLRATGDGTLVKKGNGKLIYRPRTTDAAPSAAIVSIEGGSVEATRAVAVNAAAGVKVASTLPTTQNGEILTVGAADRADAVEKVGLGTAAIASIPEGTKTVRVMEGTLALRPAKAAIRRYEVAVPNGDFSDWGGDTTSGNIGADYGGWSSTGSTGFYNYERWLATGGGKKFGASVTIKAFGFDKIPPPEGQYVLMMKVSGGTAKVDVPLEAGEYELTFMMCGRSNSGDGSVNSRLRTYLTDAAGAEHAIGIAYLWDDTKWQRKVFRFGVGTDGTYTLHLDHMKWYDDSTPDKAVLVNGLHLYRIGDSAEAWKIPNGDFEGFSSVPPTPTTKKNLDGSVTMEGWAFDTTVDGTYVRAGVSDCMTYCETGRRYGTAYNVSHSPLGGDHQLLIRRHAGWAKATFTPPKGKWYLKAHAAFWGDWSDGNGGPKVLAEVRAGEKASDLGALKLPKSWSMQPYVWATPFEADGTTEVTLTLTFDSVAGMRGVHLDDLQLVGAYEHPYELVQNGDFELPRDSNGGASARTGWAHITSAGGSNCPREYGRDNWAFGADYGSGDYFMEPYNNGGVGGICQTVTFPHAGWYRLSYLVKSRTSASQNDRLVEVDLIDADNAVTNRIDSIHRMTRGVYCQRTALFRLDGACTRNLAFLCPVQSGDYPALDDVSIRFLGETYEAVLASPDDAEIEERGLIVNVAKGACLQLDYTGTNRVSRLVVDGVKQPAGVVNAVNCPSIVGPGSLLVQPRNIGKVLIVR